MSKYEKNQLEKARMAEFLFAAETLEAKAFVKKLLEMTLATEVLHKPRRRKRRQAAQQSFERAIGGYAADLVLHSRNTDSAGFMYRPSDREALADTLVSSRSFDQLTSLWSTEGLLEVTGSIQAKEDWEGEDIGVFFARARRLRATPDLLQLASSFGITADTLREHFRREVGLVRPVTVRDERRARSGRRLSPRNLKGKGARYDRSVFEVRQINDFLASAGFELRDTPRVYRLFNRGNHPNFNYNMGGRLYCCSEDNWQQKNPEERAKITCRGEPTVELDVQASYLFILYAINGASLAGEGDPYMIPGIERDIVKGLFSAMTGKGAVPTRWPSKLVEAYKADNGKKPSELYKLGEVASALMEKHPVIETLCSEKLDWAHLQFEESECFIAAILELGRLFNVAALPVHDSLIVSARNQELAHDILGLAYERRFGVRPTIRIK